MTADQGLDWLADDEANLRPEVAEVLADVVPPAAPGPAGGVPLGRLVRAAVGVAIAVVVIAWIGHGCSTRAPRATSTPAPAGIVFGEAVNLRSEPALTGLALGKLYQGEWLAVLGSSAGWLRVRSDRLGEGWVFGAYIRGGTGGAVPGLMVRRIVLPAGAGSGLLRSGDKVLVESVRADGPAMLALPDGRHVEVPADAVVLVR